MGRDQQEPFAPPFVLEPGAANLDAAYAALEQDGIIVLQGLLAPEQLAAAQLSFRSRLQGLGFNDQAGYFKTELYRDMIEDVLALDQAFVDLVLHPLVCELVRPYIGPEVRLCEAKGWRSIPTAREFHGWHADAWYDQDKVTERIPRQLKLALYLTDVSSGGFNYIPGTHRKQPPRSIRHADYAHVDKDGFVDLRGPAGTAFMFDTSGVHRQGTPMLQDREAVFCCYHDPTEPIQPEDLDYYRYHPLILNAAFLGGLDESAMKMLGFGDKRLYVAGHRRADRHPLFRGALGASWNGVLRWREVQSRINGKVKRLVSRIRALIRSG